MRHDVGEMLIIGHKTPEVILVAVEEEVLLDAVKRLKAVLGDFRVGRGRLVAFPHLVELGLNVWPPCINYLQDLDVRSRQRVEIRDGLSGRKIEVAELLCNLRVHDRVARLPDRHRP